MELRDKKKRVIVKKHFRFIGILHHLKDGLVIDSLSKNLYESLKRVLLWLSGRGKVGTYVYKTLRFFYHKTFIYKRKLKYLKYIEEKRKIIQERLEEEIIEDQERQKKLSVCSVEKVEKEFEIKKISKKYVGLYEEILNK